MKSLHLLGKSTNPSGSRRAMRKGYINLFSAALALGLGVGSVLAQGPYYPGAQTTPNDPTTFVAYGVPVTTSPDLALIESKMPAGKTLILPPVAPKTAANAAEYNGAVTAAAQAVADAGGTLGAVTVASLAAEVANYRSAGSIPDALGAFATGVTASSASILARQGFLETLAFEAAKANPANVMGGKLFRLFIAAGAHNDFVGGIGGIVKKALDGAQAGSPAAAALQPVGVNAMITDAINGIIFSVVPSAATGPQKTALILGLASTAVTSTTLQGSPANLDAATQALTYQTAYVNLADTGVNGVIGRIKAGVVANDINYGAIAQGVLRNTAYRNGTDYGRIKTALSTTYTTDFVNAFSLFVAPITASSLVVSGNEAAVAAAGALKFPASAGSIVRDVLTTSFPGSSVVRDILNRATGAYQAGAASIATAAVGFGGATPEDIAYGAITGGPIASAGAIAKTVINTAGLTNANATAIGDSAIRAAVSVSPANIQDAYADIAYNLGNTLKLAGAVGQARSSAALNAEVSAIGALHVGSAIDTPSYVAIVAALAGNVKTNTAAERAAMLTSATGVLPGDDDAAANAGAALINAYVDYNELGNYQSTVTHFGFGGGDRNTLARLYAASLANSNDSVGALAAAIAATTTPVADLTKAAVSANRTKQLNLTIASVVANHFKNVSTNDIQAFVGQQIVDNPAYAQDITTAATVVVPQFSHVTAHALSFNAPKSAYLSVAGIFLHSKITIPGTLTGPVDPNGAGGRPAAVAAISAGLTTGIIESTQLSAADKKQALRDAVAYTVLAAANASYNDGGVLYRRSTGVGAGFTNTFASGVAGGVTGFVAQMVKPNDHLFATNTDLTNALKGISQTVGGYGFLLDIAQAAGQAYGWVSGASNAAAAATAATDMAAAIFAGYAGLPLVNIRAAVDFGFNEAKGGEIIADVARRPGAGAAGLRLNPATPYYDHHSAQGTPVSNIFTL